MVPRWGWTLVTERLPASSLSKAEHLGLDIDGDDLPVRDNRCDPETIVAGAGSDIGDDGVGREIEEGDGLGGRLFLFALVPLQPADAGVSHDLGDFPPHEAFPDAVTGGRGGGVGRDLAGSLRDPGGWCRRSGLFRDLVSDEDERDEKKREQDDGDEGEVFRFHGALAQGTAYSVGCDVENETGRGWGFLFIV